MFFEGAEKKFELIVGAELQPLTKTFSRSFWESLVKSCQATILSEISNEHMTAYLLSESSLFVWNDRILMLTCGETKLVESIKKVVSEFGEHNIESLIFQRKNEYLPTLQSSSFLDDIGEIKKLISGKSFRFGKFHSHQNLLFHLEKPYESKTEDSTTELLMYDISKTASKLLTSSLSTKEQIREFFNLEDLLPNFQIDDFAFDPYGYSLNAIRGEDYYTIHVTPQETSPYVSFETNLTVCHSSESIFHHLVKLFDPGSFDLVTFNCQQEINFGDLYWQTCHFRDRLSCGYNVDFRYYYRDVKEIEKPIVLD